MTSVIEFGEIPPPYGGVSVHVSGLIERLKRDGMAVTHVARRIQIGAEAFPKYQWPTLPRYVNHLEFFRGVGRPFGKGILHLHDNPVFFAPLVELHLIRGGRAVITVHDQLLRLRLAKSLPHERIAFRLIARSSRVRWIAVSRNVSNLLKEQGVPSERISVIPAYLTRGCKKDESRLEPSVGNFIESHCPVMIIYGYERVYLDGKDLYGFDYAIKILKDVVGICPAAGLVIFCPRASYGDKAWQKVAEMVALLGLSEHVLFLFKALKDPFPLWKSCDVLLRPTLTDGDSVAVREMLSLGKPVLASDTAPRPEGTHVISLDSQSSWVHAISSLQLGFSKKAPSEDDGYPEIKNVISILSRT